MFNIKKFIFTEWNWDRQMESKGQQRKWEADKSQTKTSRDTPKKYTETKTNTIQ